MQQKVGLEEDDEFFASIGQPKAPRRKRGRPASTVEELKAQLLESSSLLRKAERSLSKLQGETKPLENNISYSYMNMLARDGAEALRSMWGSLSRGSSILKNKLLASEVCCRILS